MMQAEKAVSIGDVYSGIFLFPTSSPKQVWKTSIVVVTFEWISLTSVVSSARHACGYITGPLTAASLSIPSLVSIHGLTLSEMDNSCAFENSRLIIA